MAGAFASGAARMLLRFKLQLVVVADDEQVSVGDLS
jgi:hypothetical protein